jgi:hypothetical protein
MSKRKPGPPRKFAPRHACGKLIQPSRAQREADEARRLQAREAARDPAICPDPDEAVSVALQQPHRRGFADPRSKRLATALGRFCARYALPEPYWRGGRDYGLLKWRFQSGKKLPGAYFEPGEGELDFEPTIAQTSAYLGEMDARLKRIETGLRRLDPAFPDERLDNRILIATRLLAWDEIKDGLDLPTRMHTWALIGLEFLAVEFEHVENSPHPFGMDAEEICARLDEAI